MIEWIYIEHKNEACLTHFMYALHVYTLYWAMVYATWLLTDALW